MSEETDLRKSGELVGGFKMPFDHVDGHRMLACATQNERVISRAVQTREDGGVRIDLIDCEGKTLLDQVACFHRADAADAAASFRRGSGSNRRRVGDASVMGLVIELRGRLDGADTLLALNELPTPVQTAAGQLREAAKRGGVNDLIPGPEG